MKCHTMQGGTREYMEILGNKREYWGILGNTKEYKELQENIRIATEYKSITEYTRKY